MPETRQCPDAARVADAAAEIIVTALDQAPGRFKLALSGGSTPPAIFQRLNVNPEFLAQADRLDLFWIDERCVNVDDADSNAGSALRNMPDVCAKAQVFRMRGEIDPDMAAKDYDTCLSEHGGTAAFDLALIGVGPDGHVASLFPGDSALDATALATTGTNPAGQKRLSVTFPVLWGCSRQLIVACGASKAGPVTEALDGNNDTAASPFARACSTHERSLIIMDTACADAVNALE